MCETLTRTKENQLFTLKFIQILLLKLFYIVLITWILF